MGGFIVVYGLFWQNIDLIVLVSSYPAVIDPNSFDLVLLALSEGVKDLDHLSISIHLTLHSRMVV